MARDVLITPASGLIDFLDTSVSKATLTLGTNGILVLTGGSNPIVIETSTSGSSALRVDGTNGTLFEVVDDLSGSLMSVNDAAGLPVLEVFADSHIVAGRYGQNDFYLDTNGNLGLGTGSPASKLDVVGDEADIYLRSADYDLVRIINRGTGSNLDKGLISVFDTGVEDVRIDSAGNSWFNGGYVGIGTTSPSYKFHLNNNGSTSIDAFYVDVGNHGGTSVLFEHTGTSSPVPFMIKKSGYTGNAQAYGLLHLHMDHANAGGGSNLYFTLDDSAGNVTEYGGIGAYIQDATNGSEDGALTFMTTENGAPRQRRMTILNNGNVGIGTNNPNRLLNISGATQAWTTAPAIQFTSTTTTSANVRNWWVGPADSSYGNFHIFPSATQGGNPGSSSEAANGITIDYVGKVGIGTASPAAKLNIAGDVLVNTGYSLFTDAVDENRYNESTGSGGIAVNAYNFNGSSGGPNIQIANSYSAGWANIYTNKIGAGTDVTNASNRHLAMYTDGLGVWSININSNYDLAFVNSGGGDLLLDPTGAGSVGIGTTSPGYELDVVGSVRARSNLYIGTGGGFFYNDSGSRVRINQDFYTNNSNTYLYGNNTYLGSSSGDIVHVRDNSFRVRQVRAYNGNGIQFQDDSGTEYMRLRDGGNVGIGQTSPVTKLHIAVNNSSVHAPTSYTNNGVKALTLRTQEGDGLEWHLAHSTNGYTGWVAAARVNNTGGNWGNGYLEFTTASSSSGAGNANVLVLSGTGNVGIGTASPSTKLQVSGNIFGTCLAVGDGNSGYLRDITGDYGSIEVAGGATGGWSGYSIDGRAVFMHNGSGATGIYNDAQNEWLFYGTHNAETRMYYNGTARIFTTGTGACINQGSSGNYGLEINGSSAGKLVMSGATDPYIRFQESTTDKAYIQWNGTAGDVRIYNQEDNTGIHINTDLCFYNGTGCCTVWHSGNSTIPTNNNQLTNGAGYTTCTGDITAVTAGTGLSGGGTSGGVTLSMPCCITAGTYGSTSDGTKIDTITVDAQGRVTAVATGATGSGSMSSWTWGITGSTTTISNGETVCLVAGTNVTLSRSSNAVTINASGGSCGTVTSVATGGGLTGGTITTSGTISHADTSSVSDLSTGPSGNRRYIKSMNFDTYGHVTGYTCNYIGFYQYNTNCLRMDYGDSTVNDIAICAGSGISITSNSGIQINNLCTSDYRLKSNLECYDTGYDIVKSVNTYKYQLNRQNETSCETGMIAHELQRGGMFHGITGEKDQVNAKNEPVYQCVSYSALVPTLWSALRKSIDKIERLENKVAELENRVNILGQCVTE